ncbi:hypothetical protein [Actinomadura geliboluensis]|uniref:hypothetical protein n=1 Tax=Actinomadura geliboluensis TaxID=882440 RepID=UPI0036AB6A4A
MTTPPTPLSPAVMERLAFIRLLHQQGVDQSRQPEPLNFTCVLTFHDAIELFLLLASEHLNVTVPGKGQGFVEKHFNPINTALGNTELSGRKGVGRITTQRNAFKHANLWPAPQAVEGFRADTASFFEENTPKVFGLAYDAIDLTDLVRQDSARALLKEARAKEASGDRIEAMALLAEAFEGIFDGQYWKPATERDPGMYRFGPEIRRPMRADSIRHVLEHSQERDKAIRTWNADDLAQQIAAVTAAAMSMQSAMRLLALGIDYHKYDKFQLLTPRVDYMFGGKREINCHPDYAPSAEDFAYCERFLITVALRLAEVEAHRVVPPWRPDLQF